METRRAFIKKAGLTAASIPLATTIGLSSAHQTPQNPQLCSFTKHFQFLNFEDLATVLKEAGSDGADLTVRPGGHIEPENTARELPKAVAAMENKGLKIPMVVSAIKSADDPGLDDYLKALSENGVKYYRMGYLNYNYDLSIEKNIAKFHDTLLGLAEKNAKYNLCGAYQNHAGNRLGASIWDLYLSLKGIDPDLLGCQFDIRHSFYEGARSWENDFRCIKDHIRTTALKDFQWVKNQEGELGHENVPMGEGIVDFNKYFKMYQSSNIPGPITIHVEYDVLTKEEEKLPMAEKIKIAVKVLKKDVDYTKKFLV
jgi:L-ribulose-5-phosphate 3-epimerase